MNGESRIRCEIVNGYSCALAIGQVITAKHGGMTGPFLQALHERWERDADRRAGICYADYTGNGYRLLVLPVVTPPANGKAAVTVLGFAQFFLGRRVQDPQEDLIGEFVSYANAPGTGHGGDGGGGGCPH